MPHAPLDEVRDFAVAFGVPHALLFKHFFALQHEHTAYE